MYALLSTSNVNYEVYNGHTSLRGFIFANLVARIFPSPALDPVTATVFPVRSTTVSGRVCLAPLTGINDEERNDFLPDVHHLLLCGRSRTSFLPFHVPLAPSYTSVNTAFCLNFDFDPQHPGSPR